MRKGKDPEPDPYIWLMDPDPGDPKTCRSGRKKISGPLKINTSELTKWLAF
jgi:hypothetical protein